MTSYQTGTCSTWVIPIQKYRLQEEFPLKPCDLAILLAVTVTEIAIEIIRIVTIAIFPIQEFREF